WGRMVFHGKYRESCFDESLARAVAEMVTRWQPEPFPGWITCVPSGQHPHLMPDFARRLAVLLRIPFEAAVVKTRPTRPQKELNNAWQQARNLDGAFRVTPAPGLDRPVLLLDDVVDSGWTLAVVSALLRQAGSGPVFPAALAVLR